MIDLHFPLTHITPSPIFFLFPRTPHCISTLGLLSLNSSGHSLIRFQTSVVAGASSQSFLLASFLTKILRPSKAQKERNFCAISFQQTLIVSIAQVNTIGLRRTETSKDSTMPYTSTQTRRCLKERACRRAMSSAGGTCEPVNTPVGEVPAQNTPQTLHRVDNVEDTVGPTLRGALDKPYLPRYAVPGPGYLHQDYHGEAPPQRFAPVPAQTFNGSDTYIPTNIGQQIMISVTPTLSFQNPYAALPGGFRPALYCSEQPPGHRCTVQYQGRQYGPGYQAERHLHQHGYSLCQPYSHFETYNTLQDPKQGFSHSATPPGPLQVTATPAHTNFKLYEPQISNPGHSIVSTSSRVSQDVNEDPVPAADVDSSWRSTQPQESIVGGSLEEGTTQHAKKKNDNFQSEAFEPLEPHKLKLQPKVEGEPGTTTTQQSPLKDTNQEGKRPAQKRLKIENAQEKLRFSNEGKEDLERTEHVSPGPQNKPHKIPEAASRGGVSNDGDEPVSPTEPFGDDKTYNQVSQQYFSPPRLLVLPQAMGLPNFKAVSDAKIESEQSKQTTNHKPEAVQLSPHPQQQHSQQATTELPGPRQILAPQSEIPLPISPRLRRRGRPRKTSTERRVRILQTALGQYGHHQQQHQQFQQQTSAHQAHFLENQPHQLIFNRDINNSNHNSMDIEIQQQQQLHAASNHTRTGCRRLEDIPLWPGADVYPDRPTSHRPIEMLDHRQQQSTIQDQYYSMGLDKRGRKLPKGRPRGGGAFRQWIKSTREIVKSESSVGSGGAQRRNRGEDE